MAQSDRRREDCHRVIVPEKSLSIAVIGAGIGGLATAALLLRQGFAVTVYEQAPAFARVGSGIQMAPNAVKVLRALGVEERLRKIAFTADIALGREWNTGEVTNTLRSEERRVGKECRSRWWPYA